MSYPTIMDPCPPAPDVVAAAKLLCLMVGANALTRALTAAILAGHGLLEERPTGASPTAVRQQTAVCRAHAAVLRHDVHALCAQAIALCREAEALCKPAL
jgi:hypothetical protein